MATVRNLIVRIAVTENTDRGIRRLTTSLRETNRELDSADRSGGRLNTTLSKLGKVSSTGLARLGASAITAGKGILVLGAAAASLNTIIQAGTALAPLTGLIALIPGVALGAAAALGTLKLGLSGTGDAFKAALANDPKKFAESLKTLTPAARSVAVELHKVRPELDYIKNSAQQGLFRPLVGQIGAVVTALKGPLASGVAAVAFQLGLAGRQAALFLRQAQTAGAVRTLFVQVATAIHQVLPALQPVLAGFRGLAVVGASFLPQMAAVVSQVAQRFGVWLQAAVATGRAHAWIANALATLRQIGTVVVQVGGILKSVFAAASAAGSGVIGVLGQALARLNAFLKTAQGQQALTGIFKGLAAIGAALGPIIGALITQLGSLAAPIADIATHLGPVLLTAINALGPAIAQLAPGLEMLLSGLGGAFTALAPALVPLGTAIAQIGVEIGPLLPIVGRLVSQLVQGLAPILQQLFVALGPLIGAILQLVGAFTPLIPPIATIIVQLVQGLVPALVPVIGIATKIAGVVGQFLVKALQLVAPVIVRMLPVISQLAQTIGRQLLIVLTALAPALLQVIQALLPLLPAIVQLLPIWGQLIVAMTPLLVILIQLVSAILSAVLPVVVRLATFLTGVLGGALKIVVGIVTTVINTIVKLFKFLYDVLVGHSIIPDLVNGILRWFGVLPSRIASIFTSLVNGAVRQMSALLKSLAGLPGSIGRIFSGAGSWLYNAGRAIIIGLWNGVKSLWNWLVGNFHSLTNLIPHIKGPPAKDARLLYGNGQLIMQGLGEGITSRLPALRRTLGRVTDSISAAGGMALATPPGVAMAGAGRSAGAAGGTDADVLARAIAQALHGASVEMDGKQVGQIVSRHLGRQTDQRRRTG